MYLKPTTPTTTKLCFFFAVRAYTAAASSRRRFLLRFQTLFLLSFHRHWLLNHDDGEIKYKNSLFCSYLQTFFVWELKSLAFFFLFIAQHTPTMGGSSREKNQFNVTRFFNVKITRMPAWMIKTVCLGKMGRKFERKCYFLRIEELQQVASLSISQLSASCCSLFHFLTIEQLVEHFKRRGPQINDARCVYGYFPHSHE